MLRNIISVANAGVLDGFSGTGTHLPEFCAKNLVYGWNASGKTTLSRLFAQLQPNSAPRLPAGAYAKWTGTDGRALDGRIDADKATINVRVFNRDFIDHNLSDHTQAPSLFILGKDNIRLNERLGHLASRRTRLARLYRSAEKDAQDAQRAFDQLATDRASVCGTMLGVRNFRAPDLKALATQLVDPAPSSLAEDELAQAVRAAHDRDSYATINVGSLQMPILPQGADLQTLLRNTPQQQALKRLTENSALGDWVRHGLQFHQQDQRCAFCGGDASQALAEYAKHFSDEYNQQRQALLAIDQRLNQPPAIPVIPPEHEWMPSLRARLRDVTAELARWKEAEDGVRRAWREQIAQKLENLEHPIEVIQMPDRGPVLLASLDALRELVGEHSRLQSLHGKAFLEAALKVKKHFAARYRLDEECLERQAEVTRTAEHLTRVGAVGQKIKTQIIKVQEQLQRQSVAAGEINALLGKLLGGRIVALQAEDGQLLFMRGAQPAHNLSDGEKTAVSLSYFLVSLHQNGGKLGEMVIFIDDPISSLDANHVHQVSTLLLRRLENAGQLFISTHSAEFFNAIKQEWTIRGKFEKGAAGYLMHRVGETRSDLLPLPAHLTRFRSDYHYVFHCLARLRENPAPDVDLYVSAPNLVRRFLEMYLSARLPTATSFQSKMNLLFDDPDISDGICRFADEGSHSQTSLRLLEVSDFPAQSRAVVTQIFNALEQRDPQHYSALVKETELA